MSNRPFPDFFDKLGNKGYLLVLGLIILIEILVFRNYFFEYIYCFKDVGGDAYNQYYPFQYLTTDYIAKYGIPKWSFSVGMGQSLFQFILRDPFDIFIYLAGKDHILYLIVYKELVKILLSGLTFFFYLKTLKLSNFTAVIGSLLFAFCSYIIVGGVWNDSLFSFPAFNMALLLLAFELLFNKQKWYLFPIAFFLIGISMPLNLYLFGLFLACYAVLRHLQTGAFDFKKLTSLFLKMGGLAIIGLLVSAPFLIENTLGILESPRGNGGFSRASTLSSAPIFNIIDKYNLGVCIMRFFSSDILGGQKDVNGGLNYFEAPMFYCGLACFLLIPQLFVFLSKRVKIIFIVFLIIWLLPIIFPYLRQAFWLFSGDYYRTYSFFIAIVFLYYSLLSLEFIVQQGKIKPSILFTTLLILIMLINYPFFNNNIINQNIFLFVITMFLVYTLILFSIYRQKNPIYFKWLFFVAVIGEILYLTSTSINERIPYTFSELPQKTGYNDYSVDAVNYLKQHDKSFYRIDKSYGSAYDNMIGYHESLDDGMAEGYYGTSCYSSFNQKYYVNYLELMGAIDKITESTIRARGLFPNHILEAENSVKYILTPDAGNHPLPMWCELLAHIGNVKIFRYKDALPLGYTYEYYMKESNFNLLSSEQKDFTSIRTCVVKDEDINKVSGLKEFQGNISPFNWQEDMTALKQDTLSISQFSENFITGTINVNENRVMYFSIPYDRGWTVKVDGQPTDKIVLNGGMTGVMLTAGNHTIELKYDLPFFNLGLLMSLLGLLIYFGYWFYYSRKLKTVS